MAQKKEMSRYIQFYTQDSTAKKLEVELVDEREWAPLPEYQIRRRRVIHIDPVAIVGILAAAILMATMLLGVERLAAIREETAQMEAQVIALQAQNRSLSQEYAAGYDITAVEQTALNMGMVPAEQAQQILIHVEQPVEEETRSISVWDRVTTFLTGLFA